MLVITLLTMGYTGRPTRGWGGELPLTGTELSVLTLLLLCWWRVACGKAKPTDPLTDMQRISLHKATCLIPAL